MKILLVEDNESIITGLKYNLELNGYKLDITSSIIDAKNIIKDNKYDLILLDVTLPDGNGFDLFSSIKSYNIPVIFLTAKDDEDDIVNGLNMGAYDYITKPFSTKELIARINRIKLSNHQNNIINIKDISFDIDKQVVLKNNKIIDLSSLELQILNVLFLNLNKVVQRETLLDKIWEITGNDVDDHTITVYMKRIREKLDTDIIQTVKGIGYRIDYEK